MTALTDRRTTACVLACLALSLAHLRAQSATVIDGPAAPVAPAVITRDAAQKATVRSDMWITYDDRNIYLSCRCYETSPPAEQIVNELRRDTGGLRNNEHIGVLFDTFYDRRSGFAFYTNPLGARADYSILDEGASNTDWNPVWTSKTERFDGGWTVAMEIPFKSLRYRAGPDQVWGMQIRRSVRHKNEWDYLTPVPRILAGPQALNRVSAGGTLVGLDLPEAGKNIELNPYVTHRARQRWRGADQRGRPTRRDAGQVRRGPHEHRHVAVQGSSQFKGASSRGQSRCLQGVSVQGGPFKGSESLKFLQRL